MSDVANFSAEQEISNWSCSEDEAYVSAHIPSFRYGVVRLLSWPDLKSAPAHMQPLAARLCALLSRKPTAGSLIPVVLAAGDDEVHRVMAALARMRHIKVSDAGLARAPAEEAAAASVGEEQQMPADLGRGRSRSLIGKLWSRLLG